MIYDLIIVGLGPAGLTASIYASRYELKHALIGSLKGGTASESHLVENYPGFESISGQELMEKFFNQTQKYHPEFLYVKADQISKNKNLFEIKTNEGKIIKTKTIILALGVQHRILSVPGEKDFLGRGVSYCPTCDGPLFKDKIIAVAGGGDSALTSALYLSKIAKKVYLIYRKKIFRAQALWQTKVDEEKKIKKILNNQIKEIKGDSLVNEIILDKPYQNKKSIKINGLFIEIGAIPSKEFNLNPPLKLKKDSAGYIVVNYRQETNVPGLFAAGDITGPADKLKQIITASAEGAISAANAYRFLTKRNTRI